VEPLMAWKKIDDAQALPDMPYSSFLANGLTTNANSYNDDMTRGGGIAWNATEAVTWSSYAVAQGFMFTVNVGQAVREIEFRITYATLTASADADGFQGQLVLQHMGGSEFVTVGLLPSAATPAFLDITLPFNTAFTGPQAFSLTFQSSKLEDLGTVNVSGGVENIIYLDGNTYPITAGEKHELLDLTGVPAPSVGEASTWNEYQINYMSTNAPNPPDGYASVYPSLVRNPPRLPSYYQYVQNHIATVYELGAITLLGIAYNCTATNPSNTPSQLSHQTAAPLAGLIGNQNIARYDFQPDLCNGVSQRYALGAVIASATTSPVRAAVSTGFSFVSNTIVDYLTLSVSMRYFGLIRGSNPSIVLSLEDEAGTLIEQVDTPIFILRTTAPTSVVGITARGWYDPTAVAAWGMRDSMSQSEMMSGQTISITVPDLYLTPGDVYTVSLDMNPDNTAIYVYNLYARLIPPIGNAG
jgi:hypothetical protein